MKFKVGDYVRAKPGQAASRFGSKYYVKPNHIYVIKDLRGESVFFEGDPEGDEYGKDIKRFELVEEAKVEKREFKVGDKVRCLHAESEQVGVGYVYEVKRLTTFALAPHIELSRIAGLFETKNFELVSEAKSELEELVEKANEGLKARHRLHKDFYKDVEVVYDDGDVLTGTFMASSSAKPIEIRIKPKPKFEPYTIKGERWDVSVPTEGILKIGCRQFTLKDVKEVFRQLLTCNQDGAVSGDFDCDATRRGIRLSEGSQPTSHILPWADAEELYNKIKDL